MERSAQNGGCPAAVWRIRLVFFVIAFALTLCEGYSLAGIPINKLTDRLSTSARESVWREGSLSPYLQPGVSQDLPEEELLYI